MKKLLSVLMVLTMVLSLSVTAFAAEQPQTGSITIVNPTIGQTYNLYKLFDASAADGHVAYTIENTNQFFSKLFNNDGTPAEGNTFFTYNSNNMQVTKVEGVNETDLLNYVKSIVQGGTYQVAGSIEAKTENLTDQKIVFENVPCGYYIVDVVGTNAAKGMITVTTNTPDAVVIDKNQMPFANGIEKKVCDVKIENDEIVTGNWSDDNTAFVGDVVGYKVSFNATNYAGMEQIRYTMKKEMPFGLSLAMMKIHMISLLMSVTLN